MQVGINKKGFTIVELLVVIVVIAILAAIAIVSYNGMISKAHEAGIQAETEQNAKAMQSYQTIRGNYATNCADAGVKVGTDNVLSCASSSDGQQFCVGVSRNGIAYYSTNGHLTPREGSCSGFVGIAAGSEFTDIAAGQGVTCGVAGGKAYCWGGNWSGQLGNGTTNDSTSPVAVTAAPGVLAGKTVTDISVGDAHGCAVADGAAYCWGEGGSGQLGNSGTADSTTPVPVNTSGVLSGKTVTKVAANGDQTCLIADARAYCFGDTYEGALGNGVTVRTDQTTPVAVSTSGVLSGKTVTDISVGGYYAYNACVVADGGAYCWGVNDWGQLGNGDSGNSALPVAVNTSGVLAGKTVTSVSMYEYHACAVADGAAYCWGGNGNGYLGNGEANGTLRYLPVAVDTTGVLAGKTVTAVAPGDYHTCVIANGQVYCFGSTYGGVIGNGVFHVHSNVTSPVAVNTAGVLAGKTATVLASGYAHACVIASGMPHCWGESWGGALGQGSDTSSGVPVLVAPLP